MLLSIFYGAVINPVSHTRLKPLPRCLLAVGPDGTIIWIVEDVPSHLLQDTLAQKGLVGVDIVVLKEGEFIIPGFIDTHTHAAQFPTMAKGQEYELLDWLEKVIFPGEMRFASKEFACQTYKIVARRTIDLGTTTCCYYGSLHLEATKALARIVHEAGQRAFVGKCNMDRKPPKFDSEGKIIPEEEDPEKDYIERSTEDSIETTIELIDYIRSLSPHFPPADKDASGQFPPPEPLVKPILTPRFALSCTNELLVGLRDLAHCNPSLTIQTHISENLKEVEDTLKAFPKARNYADVYNIFGLLRHNTILGHAVHLNEDELTLIKKNEAGIAHCPVSNFNLRSGIAPIGKYLDRGIKVGLGTDVSGGFSPSMLTVIQHASVASKTLAFQSVPPESDPKSQQPQPAPKSSASSSKDGFTNRQLRVATLFYLATLGGAEVCDIDKQVGSFAPGKSFDALLVSLRSETGNPHVWSDDIGEKTDETPEKLLEERLERFMLGGDDRNILRVYVQGRLIGGKSFRA
ncbi:hypothetical protein AX15_001080 [Amanita polypyramis BW_CC]|nr:hypothetical protein AX15_001080 [Amanita polypyramis BW_CC]